MPIMIPTPSAVKFHPADDPHLAPYSTRDLLDYLEALAHSGELGHDLNCDGPDLQDEDCTIDFEEELLAEVETWRYLHARGHFRFGPADEAAIWGGHVS